MPCRELLELQASSHRYTERRNRTEETAGERRSGKPTGFRFGEARYAYLVNLHLQSCKVCCG